MVEPVFSVLAIVLILYLGRLGAIFGVFQELSNALWMFFAMMVALRYWWLATNLLMADTPLTGSYAALVAFWAIFLIACAPLLILRHLIHRDALAPYPRILDVLLGPVFGVISATILISCIMLSVSIITPEIWEPYQRTGLIIPLDKLPTGIYKTVEEEWLGIMEKNPGHTRFPTLEKADANNFQKYWR